jgi:hypothetical protein
VSATVATAASGVPANGQTTHCAAEHFASSADRWFNRRVSPPVAEARGNLVGVSGSRVSTGCGRGVTAAKRYRLRAKAAAASGNGPDVVTGNTWIRQPRAGSSPRLALVDPSRRFPLPQLSRWGDRYRAGWESTTADGRPLSDSGRSVAMSSPQWSFWFGAGVARGQFVKEIQPSQLPLILTRCLQSPATRINARGTRDRLL